MAADDVLMLVGLGVAVLIVVSWAVTMFLTRKQAPLRQENPPTPDPNLNPWAGNNGGRW
jgi:hypothetical protein